MEKDQKDSQSAAAVAAKPPAVAGSTNVPAELGEKSAGAARPVCGDRVSAFYACEREPGHKGRHFCSDENSFTSWPGGGGIKKIGNSELAQNSPVSPPQVPATTKNGGTIEGSNPSLSASSKSADLFSTAPQKLESPYNSDPQFLLNNPPPACGLPGELRIGDPVEVCAVEGDPGQWIRGRVVSLTPAGNLFILVEDLAALGAAEFFRLAAEEGKFWRRVLPPADVEAAKARLAARVAAAGKKPAALPGVEIAGVDVCGEYPAVPQVDKPREWRGASALYEQMRDGVDAHMARISEKVRHPERLALLSLALGAVLDLVADFLEVDDEN